MSLKAKVEAIIYAAEEPITLEQISTLLKDAVLADLSTAKENAAIEKADAAKEAATAAAAEETAGNATTSATKPEAVAQEEAILPELAPASAEPILPEAQPDANATSADQSAESSKAPEANSAEAPIPDHTEAPADRSSEESTTPEIAPESAEAQQPEAPQATDAVPLAETAEPAEAASVGAPETASRKRAPKAPKKTEQEIAEDKAVRTRIREVLVELVSDYASEDRGMEIRAVAGGFRMATKPEHHDVVRAFAKSLKPPIRLSLAALETLAVIAYKQPITAPEIADIRGVESGSVLGTLIDRKLITTAGRKQVIGRPMQYKTSKEFLLRFGLNEVGELPSMEEFTQLATDGTVEVTPEPQPASLFEPKPSAQENPAEQPAESSETESADSDEQPISPNLETQSEGQQIPESQQPDAAEATDSQPQLEAESSNIPETEHPIGQ